MLQLTQKLKNGEMLVQEVPMPSLGKGMVLVKNHYSLISAGTEGSTVNAARKSLIGKAKENAATSETGARSVAATWTPTNLPSGDKET